MAKSKYCQRRGPSVYCVPPFKAQLATFKETLDRDNEKRFQ